LEDVAFVIPPRTLWPPFAGAPLAATRVRWKGARFIPLGLVSTLIAGQSLDEDHWVLDGVSECLLPVGRQGPFRISVRWASAVDRLSGAAERHSSACLEFRPGAGLWAAASFADEEARSRWADPVRASFRLLADTGFGGERSRGWGRSEQPEFSEGRLPDMILPPVEAKVPAVPDATADAEEPRPPTPSTQDPPPPPQFWLLSLFTPGPGDTVDWSRGNYAVARRGGRTESPARHGELKKHLTMVCEGSVLAAGETLRGAAPDVAPDGFPHPVFHAGYALSIPIPGQVTS
jgi:hypothetical protein